jgi:type IV pilus assembly protein PilE
MQVRLKGFSLIELMVTVAIIGILAGIAYPSYRKSVMRSHRADAIGALSKNAQSMERCYTNNGTYVGCATLITISEHGLYSLAEGTGGLATTATTFTAGATPLGSQQKDTDCAVLRMSQTGAQTSVNSSGTDSSATCWRKK